MLDRFFRGRLTEATRQMQESFSRVTASLAETVAGIRVTQSFGREAVNAGRREANQDNVRRFSERRDYGCTCYREIGDSQCAIHGEEDASGAIVVRCTDRGCLATCDVDIVGSSGWMKHTSGWLCLDHQPI